MLALASAAKAALVISVDGVVDPDVVSVAPGEHAIVGLYSDGGQPQPNYAAFMVVEGRGVISGGEMLYPGCLAALTELTWPYDPIILQPWYPDITSIILAEFFDCMDPPRPMGPGLVVDAIDFECTGMGDATIWLLDGDTLELLDWQDIHQIPEPLTVALLGFGGLLLCRKRTTART